MWVIGMYAASSASSTADSIGSRAARPLPGIATMRNVTRCPTNADTTAKSRSTSTKVASATANATMKNDRLNRSAGAV